MGTRGIVWGAAFAALLAACGVPDGVAELSNCGPGEVCLAASTCCPPGMTYCHGQCKDLSSDPANCGACGQTCAQGETCEGGMCKTPCGPGLTECSGECVDLSSDLDHCGQCDVACHEQQECISGQCTEACVSPATSLRISSNFNGTRIHAGNYIWFNAVLKVGSSACLGHLYFRDGKVTFSAAGLLHSIDLPDAMIELEAGAATATTELNGLWHTRVPPGTSGNVFLTGLAWEVPAELPGGINPVAMTGTITSDCGPRPVSWKWAAAVYTCFNTSTPMVKAVDANGYPPFTGSEHAGTPMDSKSCVVGGARGGGGSNFTGSYSGTQGTTVESCT